MTDPNVKTTPEGEEVILEPGDPGYVDPKDPDQGDGQQAVTGEPIEEGEAFGPDEPLGAEAPPGEDLTHKRDPEETDAEFLARTRGTVVVSESPTDIVPNTPQITMGERVEVEGREGVVYASTPDPSLPTPVEEEPADLEEHEEPEVQTQEEPSA